MSSDDLTASVAAVNKELQIIDDQIQLEQNQILTLLKLQEDLDQEIKSEKTKNEELIENLAEEQTKESDRQILAEQNTIQLSNMQIEIEQMQNKIKGARDTKMQMVDKFVALSKKQLKRCSIYRWHKFKEEITKREIEMEGKKNELLDRIEEQKQQKQHAEQILKLCEMEVQDLKDEVQEIGQQLQKLTQQQITQKQEVQNLLDQKRKVQEKQQEEIKVVEQQIDVLHEEMAIQEVEIRQLETQRWKQELQNQELKKEIENINKKIQAIQVARKNQANHTLKIQAVQTKPAIYTPCYKQRNPLPTLQIQQFHFPKIHCNNINIDTVNRTSNVQQVQSVKNQSTDVKYIQDTSNVQQSNNLNYNGQTVSAQSVGGKALSAGIKANAKQEIFVQPNIINPGQNKLKRKSGPKGGRRKQHQKMLKLATPTQNPKKQTEEIQDVEDRKCDLFGGLL